MPRKTLFGFVGVHELSNQKVYILGILGIFTMATGKVLPDKKDGDITSMKVNVWFLRFLDKFRIGRESWQEINMRVITSKKLNKEDSNKLKQEIANYEKSL